LRSNVSVWLGPPDIHSKMQERTRCLMPVAWANAPSQPEAETPEMPATPAAESLSQSRREKPIRMADFASFIDIVLSFDGLSPTLKGLNPEAQGCRAAATLGHEQRPKQP